MVSRICNILPFWQFQHLCFIVYNKFKTYLDKQYAQCEKIILERVSNIWKGFLFLFGLFGYLRYTNKGKSKNLRLPLLIWWSNQIGQWLPQSCHLQIAASFLLFWFVCLLFPFLHWLQVPTVCCIRAGIFAFSLDFWGKHSVFHHLTIVWAIGFWFIFFIKVKKFPSIPSLIS